MTQSQRRAHADISYIHIYELRRRTLLDGDNRHERRTAVIAHEQARYDIDIAALSETRISGSTQFEEVSAGYTFV